MRSRLGKLLSSSRKRRRNRPSRHVVRRGEALEARCLLTTNMTLDPDGPGAAFGDISDVESFDWEPGSIYAEDNNLAIVGFLADQADNGVIDNGPYLYKVYGNSILNSIERDGATDISPEVEGFEYTLVFGAELEVTDVDVDAGTGLVDVTSSLAASPTLNFLEIYFDTTPDAIPLDGTGFGDGQLIFRGAFSVVNSEVDSISNTPVPLDSLFPDNLEPLVPDPPIGNTVQTISTLAAVQFESDVVDVDPTFFKDPLGLLRTGVDFAGGGTAFSTVNPSQAFVTMPNPDADLSDGAGPNPDLQAFPLTTDTPGVGIGAVNGDTLPGSPVGGQQGGPDFILQYDSSTPFLVDQPAIHVEKAINAVDPLSPTVAEDADNPTGPALAPGTPVVWTYLVTAEDELGKPSDTPIEIVSLVDDFGTPGVLGDDFNPLPVLAGLFNVGDTNMNGLLDPQTLTSPGETWLYTSEGEVAYNVVAGQYKNIAKVTGNPVDETGVDLPGAPDVMDDDPNHHIGIDAKITIAPDDTNEVGDDHTFTTIVWVDDGTGSDVDGEMGTFDRWEGADVTVSLANFHGAVANPAGPFMGATDVNGEYDVTFTSQTAGQVVGTATAEIMIGGAVLIVSTDGLGDNSGPATKTFVDAKITITPDDTNEVGDDHTFTTVFWVDDGTGTDLDGEMGTFDRWEAARIWTARWVRSTAGKRRT